MKPSVCFLIPAIVALSTVGLAQDKPPATKVDGNINWVFDLEEGRRLSKQQDRPLFIVFRCER